MREANSDEWRSHGTAETTEKQGENAPEQTNKYYRTEGAEEAQHQATSGKDVKIQRKVSIQTNAERLGDFPCL